MTRWWNSSYYLPCGLSILSQNINAPPRALERLVSILQIICGSYSVKPSAKFRLNIGEDTISGRSFHGFFQLGGERGEWKLTHESKM